MGEAFNDDVVAQITMEFDDGLKELEEKMKETDDSHYEHYSVPEPFSPYQIYREFEMAHSDMYCLSTESWQ